LYKRLVKLQKVSVRALICPTVIEDLFHQRSHKR